MITGGGRALVWCLMLAVGAQMVACLVSGSPEVWLKYKREHGKIYGSSSEDSLRRAIFERNKRYIDRFNTDHDFRLGPNHLTDWTREELATLTNSGGRRASAERARLNRKPVGESTSSWHLSSLGDTPKEFDWRNVTNRVTPVKYQGELKFIPSVSWSLPSSHSNRHPR